MTINRAMFGLVYGQIAAEPWTHNQDHWEDGSSCGTTRCIAGWAVYFDMLDQGIEADSIGYHPDYSKLIAGGGNPTSRIAQRVLGLTDDQAKDLFLDSDDESAVDKVLRYWSGRLS